MISQSSASSQFSLNRIPFHSHNGKDSPSIVFPTLTYSGYVTSDGKKSRTRPFPPGWGITRVSAGLYTITHKLNTSFYVVNAIGNDTTQICVPKYLISTSGNSFQILWSDSATQAATDTGWSFTLTTVVNSKPGFPNYNQNAS